MAEVVMATAAAATVMEAEAAMAMAVAAMVWAMEAMMGRMRRSSW